MIFYHLLTNMSQRKVSCLFDPIKYNAKFQALFNRNHKKLIIHLFVGVASFCGFRLNLYAMDPVNQIQILMQVPDHDGFRDFMTRIQMEVVPPQPLTNWQQACLKEIWLRITLKQFLYRAQDNGLVKAREDLLRVLFSDLKIKSFHFTSEQMAHLIEYIDALTPLARNLIHPRSQADLFFVRILNGIEATKAEARGLGTIWTQDVNPRENQILQAQQLGQEPAGFVNGARMPMRCFFQFLSQIVIVRSLECIAEDLIPGLRQRVNDEIVGTLDEMHFGVQGRDVLSNTEHFRLLLSTELTSVPEIVESFKRLYSTTARNADFAKVEYILKHYAGEEHNKLMRRMSLQLLSYFVKSARIANGFEQAHEFQQRNAKRVARFTSAGIWYLISLHDLLTARERITSLEEVSRSLEARAAIVEPGFSEADSLALEKYNQIMPLNRVCTQKSNLTWKNATEQRMLQANTALAALRNERNRLQKSLMRELGGVNTHVRGNVAANIPQDRFQCECETLFGIPYLYPEARSMIAGDEPILEDYTTADIDGNRNISLFFHKKAKAAASEANLPLYRTAAEVLALDQKSEDKFISRLKNAALVSEASQNLRPMVDFATLGIVGGGSLVGGLGTFCIGALFLPAAPVVGSVAILGGGAVAIVGVAGTTLTWAVTRTIWTGQELVMLVRARPDSTTELTCNDLLMVLPGSTQPLQVEGLP